MPDPEPKRKWFQFGLRLLLLATMELQVVGWVSCRQQLCREPISDVLDRCSHVGDRCADG